MKNTKSIDINRVNVERAVKCAAILLIETMKEFEIKNFIESELLHNGYRYDLTFKKTPVKEEVKKIRPNQEEL